MTPQAQVAHGEFTWAGKGATLYALADRLSASRVPPGRRVTREAWRHERERVLATAHDLGASLAVRSSHAHEDTRTQSHAGRYLSRLGVCAADAGAVAAAIDAVFASYGSVHAHDEVLLQPMVPARLAAVAATHAIEDGAPYYVYSLAPGARSDAVTRGDTPVRTVYLARDGADVDGAGCADADVAALHAALRELEALCGHVPIEAEFVLDAQAVVLLQVRPLTRAPASVALAARRSALAREACAAAPTLAGTRRALALMPDWNPAELLGAHPRPLALDVFVALIGRRAWRRARALLGYARCGNVDLIARLGGRPYVDVQASANSLLPAGLPRATAAALVDAWQDRLLAQPALHDRYEFEIAQTCLDFDLDAAHRARYAGLLDAARYADWRARLGAVTRRCVAPATLAAALARVDAYAAGLDAAEAPPAATQLRRAEREAALPFALIARLAFVYEALLRSAVARGALAPDRLGVLRATPRSVTHDYLAAARGARAQRYGFLRAGTFEITTPRVAHFALADTTPAPTSAPEFVLRPTERRALQQLLAEAALPLTADLLVAGYAATRRAREYAKYVLAQGVSALLERLAVDGAAHGLAREDLSWIGLQPLLAGIPDDARAHAAAAQAAWTRDALLRLPCVWRVGQSLDGVVVAAGEPSWLGRGRLTAPLVRVRADAAPAALPPHSIVAIESADPGYDWIFTRAPAALITAFGGPNSHMAIRCAELGVPAVLGLGVERWRRLAAAERLVLDVDAQSIASWPPLTDPG